LAEYEVTFIIRGTETDEAAEALIGEMEQVVRQGGAEILKVDRWGRRKLAYDIGKQREGVYVLFHLKAEAPPIKELERKLKMTDLVIRFLTVRIDDEVRRARRRAEIRARRKGLEPGAAVAIGRPARSEDEGEEEPGEVAGRGDDEDEEESER
jgi:small subunit ribosomal protein S6